MGPQGRSRAGPAGAATAEEGNSGQESAAPPGTVTPGKKGSHLHALLVPCTAVLKAGGMRIVQKHPHSGDTKEEKDKDDQEWESPSSSTGSTPSFVYSLFSSDLLMLGLGPEPPYKSMSCHPVIGAALGNSAALTEDWPVDVPPVDKDKNVLCFVLVATETGHLETGMTCVLP
ncbi:hypothetical protein GH733_004688 [Mirounga leonina]|nr:hypothetical protein GH733_004688 [Mirounga leonina]